MIIEDLSKTSTVASCVNRTGEGQWESDSQETNWQQTKLVAWFGVILKVNMLNCVLRIPHYQTPELEHSSWMGPQAGATHAAWRLQSFSMVF